MARVVDKTSKQMGLVLTVQDSREVNGASFRHHIFIYDHLINFTIKPVVLTINKCKPTILKCVINTLEGHAGSELAMPNMY